MLPAGISSEGSPPRGRGKVCIAFLGLSASRITPAWAGKSKRPAFPVCVMWDHPRVGGEKPEWTSLEEIERGSPPRGRGKGIFAILALSATGITPAWAGKRCLNDLVDVDWQDHPRVGGEKEWTVHYHRQTEGSPPRGRGKGIKRSSHAHQTGITPAWAGKS